MYPRHGSIFGIVVVLSMISIVSGLLKNCLKNPSDWDTDQTPKCEIISVEPVSCFYDNDEIEVSVDRLDNPDSDYLLIPRIICNASYPIDFDQDGFKYKGEPVPKFFRFGESPNAKNFSTKQPTFSIVVPLIVNFFTPRSFIFSRISNQEIQTRFYLYHPGSADRSLPFDWPNQKITPTVVEPETPFAILPCQVSNRSDQILLQKNRCSTGQDEILDKSSRLSFKPKEGFIVDTSDETAVDSPWGIYTCVAQNPRKAKNDLEMMQVTLRKPKEFTPIPSDSDLFYFAGESIKMSCKSSTPITMSGEMKFKNIPDYLFKHSENATLRSRFRIDFVYENAESSDFGQISCQTRNGLYAHSWSFRTLDFKKNEFIQLNNNGNHVSCTSNTSNYITIFNAECFNPSHCRSRMPAVFSFGSGQCDLRIAKIVQCATPCKGKPGKCLSIQQSRRMGIYRCETDTLTHPVQYLIGYDKKIYTEPNVYELPRDAIIQVDSAKDIFVGAISTFTCRASSYISNGEFLWSFKSVNSAINFQPTILDKRDFQDFATNNDSIWEVDVVFDKAEPSVQVICHVPVWDTVNQFINNSILVNIMKPIKPEIDARGSEQTYYIGDNERTLTCSAIGNPAPSISWLYDGKELLNMTSDQGKSIDFKEINSKIIGTYTCIAKNFAGEDKQDFIVSVQDKPNITLYVVLGVILVLLLTIGIVVLYWRLIKAKDEIRQLSDEEVKEFKYGNPEAAKAAKEPHEIIMYLPFNKDYEIPRDSLAFDEGDILGSGAYGVVFKGKIVGMEEEVAIKTLKPHSGISYFKALLSELKIMVYIGKSANVVHLIGAYTGKIKERILYMVVELSPFGNLEDYTRKNKEIFRDQIKNDSICVPVSSVPLYYENMAGMKESNSKKTEFLDCFCTTNLLSIARQIADGMNHLAIKKVIHADLASRNVLLYHNGIVKITDFGLSRQLYAYTSYMKKEQEPLPWRAMAIESLREMNFSTQSDVWAFGVLLWEMFSLGATPYPGLSWSVDFVDMLINGLRLSKPQYATTEIYDVMVQCWHQQPEERPTFEDLSLMFTEMFTKADAISRENKV